MLKNSVIELGRYVLVSGIFMLIVAAPVRAQQRAAEFMIGAALAVPLDDPDYRTGPMVHAGIGLGTRGRASVRLSAQHARFENKVHDGELSISGGTLQGAWRFREQSIVCPNIAFGGGFYSVKRLSNTRRTSFGLLLGVGVDAQLSARTSLFVDTRLAYHFADTGTEFEPTVNWPVIVGIRYRLPYEQWHP